MLYIPHIAPAAVTRRRTTESSRRPAYHASSGGDSENDCSPEEWARYDRECEERHQQVLEMDRQRELDARNSPAGQQAYLDRLRERVECRP